MIRFRWNLKYEPNSAYRKRRSRTGRNKTENRLKNKASKRDIAVSESRMLSEDTKYRLVSNEGEIPFENYMKIDNTNLEPSDVARMIKERFNLPNPLGS